MKDRMKEDQSLPEGWRLELERQNGALRSTLMTMAKEINRLAVESTALKAQLEEQEERAERYCDNAKDAIKRALDAENKLAQLQENLAVLVRK